MKPRSRSGVAICMLALFTALSGCDTQKSTELERKTSPDSRVDAVLVRSGGGATTGYVHEVFLVPKGGTVAEDARPNFTADQVDNLQLQWDRPNQLRIAYTTARIIHFSNFWQSRDVDAFDYVVDVRLQEIGIGATQTTLSP